MNFHPHCVNKAPSCRKQHHNTSSALSKSKVRHKKNHTPLGPLKNDINKAYLPVFQQQTNQHPRHRYHHYKSEGYIQTKDESNGKRNFVSSIMT
jgi:hypothetical protein